LIVDEAQNLTGQAVEELRMLSNFQLDTHALLQSFLVGQPEFRQMLESPDMQQLRQRVIAACHIGSMDQDETQGYVEHRLKCVGWTDSPEFSSEAYKAIFEGSGGIPRRINSLCDRLLLSGFLSEKRRFEAEDVSEIANEFREETSAPRHMHESGAGSAGLDDHLDPQRTASQIDAEVRSIQAAYPHTGAQGADVLGERLKHIEQGLIRLETTLLRLERTNSSVTSQFRGLIDWIKARESERSESE
jgi:general secretion pathway protein A